MPRNPYRRWIAPTLLCGLLAAAYAYPSAILYRCELTLAASVAGESSPQVSERRIGPLLETVRQHCHRRALLASALQEARFWQGQQGALRVADEELPKWDHRISVTSLPDGAVGPDATLLLAVEAETPCGAVSVCEALFGKLRDELQAPQPAAATPSSVVHAVESAAANLARLTNDLTTAEEALIRAESADQRAEPQHLSQLQQQMAVPRRLLTALKTDEDDTTSFASLPPTVLPADAPLRRLHQDLIAAERQTTTLRATMRERHPLLTAAAGEEQRARQQLRQERERTVARLEHKLRQLERLVEQGQQAREAAQRHRDAVATLRSRCHELEVERQRALAAAASARAALAESQVAPATATIALTAVGAPRESERLAWPRLVPITLSGLACGLVVGLLRVWWAWPATAPNHQVSRGLGTRPGHAARERSTFVATPASAGGGAATPVISEVAALHDAALMLESPLVDQVNGEAEPPALPLPVGPVPPQRRFEPPPTPHEMDPVPTPDEMDADREEDREPEPPQDRAPVAADAAVAAQAVEKLRVDPPEEPLAVPRLGSGRPPTSRPGLSPPDPSAFQRSAALVAELVKYRKSVPRTADVERPRTGEDKNSLEESLLSVLEEIYEDFPRTPPTRTMQLSQEDAEVAI